MTLLNAALFGFVLALGLILPLGVQNTFVFTQGAIHRRWVSALPAVITAAVCDTLLILLAVSGVSLVVLQVSGFKAALSWFGVAFLLYMGWVTWRTAPAVPGQARGEWPLRRQIVFSASVSLLNPHAILDTIGVIGTNSLRFTNDTAALTAYTLACVGVSWAWFLGLMTAGHFAGSGDASGSRLRILNKVSAVIMWAVAAQLAASLA